MRKIREKGSPGAPRGWDDSIDACIDFSFPHFHQIGGVYSSWRKGGKALKDAGNWKWCIF